MPIFLFDVAGDGAIIADHKGKRLPELADAHEHALELIKRIVDAEPEPMAWRSWRVEVRRGSQVVLTVLFSAVTADRAQRGRARQRQAYS